jgi:Domain of unknown function (DUF4136)
MKHILVLFIFAVLTGCSPQIGVYSDFDQDYDLSSYKTFDWGQKIKIEEDRNPLHYNELNDKRIKAAVLEQMTMRGYQLTSENPDLIFHYHIVIDDQSVVATDPYGYYYGPYWTHMQTNVFTYRQGTLILDLMERKSQDLVWRGWAVTDIGQIKPDEVSDIIKTTVARIFKKYPKATVRQNTPNNVTLN